MNVGHLFVLFGLNVQNQTFRHGLHMLAAVQMAASSAVEGMMNLAHGVISLTENLSEKATHIHSLSQSMGMTIEQAQRWGYVAEQSGSNLKELSIGVSMLQSNLAKLAHGEASPKLIASFNRLRVTAAQAKEAMKGPEGLEKVMMGIADRFKEMGVGGEGSAEARHALGARAGRALQADMIQGSENIKAMFARMDAIGGVISGENIVTLQKIFDRTVDIKKAWFGVVGTIIAELAPELTKILDKMALWIGQHRAVIKEVFTVLVMHLIKAFEVLMVLLDALGKLLQGLFRGDLAPTLIFSAMAAGVLVLALAIRTALLPTIHLLTGALWAAAEPLLPILLLFALVIAASILIYTHWSKISEFFAGVGEFLKTKFLGAVEAIVSAWHSAGDKFSSVIDTLVGVWDTAWGTIKSRVLSVLDDILVYAIKAINAVTGLLNHIPGVDLGKIETPDWFKPAEKAITKQVQSRPSANAGGEGGDENTANAPAATFGPASGTTASNVSIAPTTVNIYGVKDAKEASGHIADAIDQHYRHAAASLGGEVV